MRARFRLPLLLLALAFAAGCENLLTRPIRYARIVVEVKTPTGEPLPGMFTILYTGARPMSYARTNAEGVVEFPFVPPAQYGVWVVNGEYQGQPHGVRVARDEVYP